MSAPGYWQSEVSGRARVAVEAYLSGDPMTKQELAWMREYLRQWIFSPVWDQNPFGGEELAGLRDMIPSLTTRAQIDLWIARAVDAGLDPL